MGSSNTYENLDSLLHIIANGQEVVGIAIGVSALLSGWIPMVCGARGYTSKIYLLSIANYAIALGSPMAANILIQESHGNNGGTIITAAMTLAILAAIASIIFCIVILFFPTIMAVRENPPNRALIVGLNFGGIPLPILWLVALVLVSLAVKKKRVSPIVPLMKDQISEPK